MTTPEYASLVYYSDPIVIASQNFTLPTGIPDNAGTWELLGLPDTAARLAGSPGLYLRTIGSVTRLWYSLQIELSPDPFSPTPGTFQANFPTDKARIGALKNLLTRWLEKSSGMKWTAEDPVFFDSIPTILGTALTRYWRADDGITLNGSLVSAWLDSVSAISLAEAVAGNQPLFQASNTFLNNRPSVSIGSANKDLHSGALAAQPQAFETFVMTVPVSANGVVFSGNAPGISELKLTAGIASYTTDGVNIISDPVAIPVDGSSALIATVADGGVSQIQVNKRAAVQGDAGMGAPTAFWAFNDTTQAAGVDQTVAEIFATNTPTFQAARDRIWAYMTGMYRWNLPNP